MAPVQNLLRLPQGVSLEEAAVCERAAVALEALSRAGGYSFGETVAVFGAGPVGLLVAQWGRAMGASTIWVVDVVSAKLSIARQLGFEHLVNAREQNPVEAIENLTRGLGVDICVDAAGVPATTLQCLHGAGRGERVVLLGNPPAEVLLPADLISRIMRRELRICDTWNSDYSALGENDDWHSSLAGMLLGTIRVKPLISHTVRLDRAFEVLRMMRDSRELYCKVLIYPESGGK